MHVAKRRHFGDNAAILAPDFSLLPSYIPAGNKSRLRIIFENAPQSAGTPCIVYTAAARQSGRALAFPDPGRSHVKHQTISIS
jgi:hypothetical protein